MRHVLPRQPPVKQCVRQRITFRPFFAPRPATRRGLFLSARVFPPSKPSSPTERPAATNPFFSLRNTGQRAILFITGYRLNFTVRRIAGKAAVYRTDGGRSCMGFTPQPTCWPPPLLTGRGIFIFSFCARQRKQKACRAVYNARENNIFFAWCNRKLLQYKYIDAQDHCGKRRRI